MLIQNIFNMVYSRLFLYFVKYYDFIKFFLLFIILVISTASRAHEGEVWCSIESKALLSASQEGSKTNLQVWKDNVKNINYSELTEGQKARIRLQESNIDKLEENSPEMWAHVRKIFFVIILFIFEFYNDSFWVTEDSVHTTHWLQGCYPDKPTDLLERLVLEESDNYVDSHLRWMMLFWCIFTCFEDYISDYILYCLLTL
jgi:hypothetical protein